MTVDPPPERAAMAERTESKGPPESSGPSGDPTTGEPRAGVSLERVLSELRSLYPPRFALEGDKTGLQVGRSDLRVSRVLTTLDLTLEVAEEARDLGVGLIVSHHAVIFRPLQHLRTDDFKVRILEQLLKHEVAVYVPHTALDVVPGGLNDALADAVGLSETRFLRETGRDPAALVILGAPEGLALEAAELCAQRGASVERREGAVHARLSARDAPALARALEARFKLSPEVFALESQGEPRGIGRIGRLPAPERLSALAQRLKDELGAPGVRLVARDPEEEVSQVAVLCGDGRSFLGAACFAGAQALVTGDVDHHTALEARARGVALVDVGHWASEQRVATLMRDALQARLAGEPVEVVASEALSQPFLFL